jgi:hypothetical protein
MSQTVPVRRNRRGSIRRKAKRGTRACCRKGGLDLGANLTLAVIDLSETGIGLVLKASLSSGQEVTVSLDSPGGYRPVTLLGNVVWAAPVTEGSWGTGVRFQKPLPYRYLLDLAGV